MSSEVQKLSDSLREYEIQLQQVNATIQSASNDSEKDTLSSLRGDIEQLITLTRENLLELQESTDKTGSVKPSHESDNDDDPFAKEYALFKAELEDAAGPSKDQEASAGPSDIPDIAAELEALQGMKCQAPFCHGWGTSYHNALVFHVEPADNITGMDQIQVRVMFTNPIETKMIPCTYYLEGECRFDDQRCRFSHGEIAQLSNLKEYKEPNFDSIKGGSRVLVLINGKDKLWHRAIVQHEIKNSIWEVKLESSGGSKIQVGLKDMLPLEGAEDCKSESESLSDDSDDSDDEYGTLDDSSEQSAIVQLSLSKTPSSALGAWEQHTKGIGSRLMEKMGYITGTGLGPSGEGRVEPVEAVVFPPGKSLDHCMRLKEQAEGDNLLKTEKKLRRLKKKQLEQQKAKYEREKKRVNVFDFINSKLGDINQPSSSKERDGGKALKNESQKSLNLANLQVGEDIRRAEKDLIHLKESLGRQTRGTPAYSAIAGKVAGKEKEIKHLQESEKKINAEQNLRKGNKKMTVF
ncbi:Zinc finger CCCH-type with G patch domain-containing protein [Frankliniella fusca]|uniref:Zinc finger CCCH-type with G patch domain-containing protein n=1 Tax=Frankliniella fusca TaxID=407009 RepID=A0AAE1H9H3_9NEOP|nr:Zinc finger CCCH-type with G patch domain-containing protein [Frankliniella fusca]